MGLVTKTLEQLWSSFYVESRNLEGYKVENVKKYPQVRVLRLTEQEVRFYTEKNEHLKKDKKLISRRNRIESDSEDDGVTDFICGNFDSEREPASLGNYISSVNSNDDNDDFLPDISLTPQKPFIPSYLKEDKSNTSIQNELFSSKSNSKKIDYEPKAFKSLVHIIAQKAKSDGKTLQSSDEQAKSGHPEISAPSTSTQKSSKNISSRKSSDILRKSGKRISPNKTAYILPRTDHNKSNLPRTPNKRRVESVTKKENSTSKLKNLSKNDFKEKSIRTVGDKIGREIEMALKRRMESEFSKISQTEIATYVSCDAPSPSKKICLDLISKSTQTMFEKPEEENKLPLLSKPAVSIIDTELENVDLKIVDISTVDGIKNISNTVLNVVQNLKNHKEKLEEERNLELESLKKKYSTKFQEVDEKIKEFTKLDDKLFNEMKEMRLNNSLCNKLVKEEIEKLFEKFSIAENKAEDPVKGASIEKQICDNNNTKESHCAKVITKRRVSLLDEGKASKYNTSSKPKHLQSSEKNHNSSDSTSRNSDFVKTNKTLSNQKSSEVKFHGYSRKGNNTSKSSKFSSSSTTTTTQSYISQSSGVGDCNSTSKISSAKILDMLPTDTTLSVVSKGIAEQRETFCNNVKPQPAIRTIPEANVERFGSSVTKVNSVKKGTGIPIQNQENSSANSTSTLSSPSVIWTTTSSNTANSSTLDLQSSSSNTIISSNSQSNKIPSISVITSTRSPNLNIKGSSNGLSTETSGYHQLPIRPISTQASNTTSLESQPQTSKPQQRLIYQYAQQNQEQQQSQQQNLQNTLSKSQNPPQLLPQVKNSRQIMSQQTNLQQILSHQQNHQQTLPKSQNLPHLLSQANKPQQNMSHQTNPQQMSQQTNQQNILSQQQNHQQTLPKSQNSPHLLLQANNQQQMMSRQANPQQIIPQSQTSQQYLPQKKNMPLYSQQQNQMQIQMQLSSQPQQKHFQQFQQPAQQKSINVHPVSHTNHGSFYNNNNNMQNPVYPHQNIQKSVGNIFSNEQSNRYTTNSTTQQNRPITQQTTGFSENQYTHLVPASTVPPYTETFSHLPNNQSQTTGYQLYLPQQQQQLNQHLQQPAQDLNILSIQHRQNIQMFQVNTVGVVRNESPEMMPIITNTMSLAQESSSPGGSNSSDRTCFLCGLPAQVLCCGSYVYCGIECQNEDYERHKQECLKLAS